MDGAARKPGTSRTFASCGSRCNRLNEETIHGKDERRRIVGG